MVLPEDIAQSVVILENGKAKKLAVIVKDKYFDLPGLSSYCDLAVSTLRDYLRHGRNPIPYFKVKGKILVRKTEFDAWLEGFRANRKVDLNAIADEVVESLKKA